MTKVQVDAATLARIQAGEEAVYVCDERGAVVLRCVPAPPRPLEGEPTYAPGEWEAIMSDPRRYTTDEVLARLRGLRGD